MFWNLDWVYLLFLKDVVGDLYSGSLLKHFGIDVWPRFYSFQGFYTHPIYLVLTQGDDGEVGGGGEAIDESMEVQIDLLCGDCIIVNFYINA